jgi:hypothetical protein
MNKISIPRKRSSPWPVVDTPGHGFGTEINATPLPRARYRLTEELFAPRIPADWWGFRLKALLADSHYSSYTACA